MCNAMQMQMLLMLFDATSLELVVVWSVVSSATTGGRTLAQLAIPHRPL